MDADTITTSLKLVLDDEVGAAVLERDSASQAELDVLEEELQRVMDDFDGRSRSGAEAEPAGASGCASTGWACAQSVRGVVDHLSSTLAALGFPSSLALEADTQRPALAAAGACSALEALLAQCARDAAVAAAAAERLAAARSEAGVAAGARERLAARLDAKERALGALENQARAAEEAASADMARLRGERDEAARQAADLRQRYNHALHELRRREQEYVRLQAHLRDLLGERKREQRACLEAAGQFLVGSVRRSGRDDEVYKKIVSAYEAKAAEMTREAAGLRAALDHLQREHRRLLNQQVRTAHAAAAARGLVEDGLEAALAGLAPDALQAALAAKAAALQARAAALPDAHEAEQGAAEPCSTGELAALRAVLAEQEALTRTALAALAHAHSQAASAQQAVGAAKAAAEDHAARAARLGAAARRAAAQAAQAVSEAQAQRERAEAEAAQKAEAVSEAASARALAEAEAAERAAAWRAAQAARAAAEAEAAEKVAVQAARVQAEAEAAARERERAEEHRHLRALEAEYADRVSRLEASQAAAERQAHLEGTAAAEQARRLNEEVSAERKRVRAALAALEAERARLDARSAAETERLQALAFQLGAQQWEFEAARDAFGDTMRKFAPGGGAGHFLARAIARRSEQEARARCADKQGGAAEAGQRAAAALAASLALSSLDAEPRVVDARAQLSASPAKVVAQELVWVLLALAVGAIFWTTGRSLRSRTPGGLKPFSQMPAPPQTPIVGNLFDLSTGERLQIHLKMQRWAQELGPIYRYNVMGKWKIVVSDTALLPLILGQPGLPKSPMYRKLRPLWSWNEDIMFTRLHRDPHWRSSRKTLARAFSADETRKKFGATLDATLKLADKLATLPDGAPVEAQDALRLVTMDVTLSAGFGIPSNTVALLGRPVPVLEAWNYACMQSSRRITDPMFALYERWLPFLPAVRENRKLHETLYQMYEGMLDQMEARGPVAENDNSMWGCLKRIQDPKTGKPLTRKQLTPEMAGLFSGALDTTSQTCAITLGLIAGHPEVFIYGLHHSSKYWDAPEEFRPERWLSPEPAGGKKPAADGKEGTAEPVHVSASVSGAEARSTKWTSAAADAQDGRKAAFVPFSGGPTDCVGQRLAMMEAPLMLAVLLSRFEVELDESMCGLQGMLERQCITFGICIDQGLHIKFKPRAGWRPATTTPHRLRREE
ncbi:hypothetical protein WJX81_007511 [Elliptochloris bilobata]|uniref:Cytochrome P450 n=1 Tax=Elliptochloris bilobata TaxID=381761 RepID=A0AAW1QXG0_9CHLO